MTNGQLAVQCFLRAGGTLADLEARYAIKAKRHGKRPNLVHLKYNQIDSPFAEEVVQDCRGLVLDESNDWRAVCLTYRKFFNYGEGTAADIHWPSARVLEKVDGSLIQMFHYDGEWLVTTSGTPDAECPVGDYGTTFSALFWKTWRSLMLDESKLDPGCCYAFELCTPLNRVVVPHTDSSIWLHGVRDMGREMRELEPAPYAMRCGARWPQEFPLRSIEECVEAARRMDPMAQEGYVVRDGGWQRVKMKCPAYVALAHAKDGLLSRRAMGNAIRAGEAGELRVALEAFPELRSIFDELRGRHEALVFDAAVLWQAYKGIEDQKDFALQVKAHPRCQPILFHLKKRGVDVEVDPAVRGFLGQLTENAYFRAIDADYPNRPQETP